MKKLIIALLALVALVAGNCARPPGPPGPLPTSDASAPPVPTPVVTADAAPPPAVDAGPPPMPVTPIVAMCVHLAALGCKEGADPTCAIVTQHVLDARLTKVDLPCLTKAATKKAAMACGYVLCP